MELWNAVATVPGDTLINVSSSQRVFSLDWWSLFSWRWMMMMMTTMKTAVAQVGQLAEGRRRAAPSE